MNIYLVIIVALCVCNVIALTTKAIRRKYITLYGRAFANLYLAIVASMLLFNPLQDSEILYIGIIMVLFFSLSDILVYFMLKNQYSTLSYMKALEQLSAITDKYYSIVENTPIGFYVIDELGRFEYINKYILEMTGYTSEELLGRRILDIIDEEYHPLVKENIRRRLSGEVKSLDYVIRIITKSGDRVKVRLSSSRTENGHVTITGSAIIVED